MYSGGVNGAPGAPFRCTSRLSGRATAVADHMPQTVLVGSSAVRSSQRTILSPPRFRSVRSKMSKWPAYAAERSRYPAVWSRPWRTVCSRLLGNTLHWITNRPAASGLARPCRHP